MENETMSSPRTRVAATFKAPAVFAGMERLTIEKLMRAFCPPSTSRIDPSWLTQISSFDELNGLDCVIKIGIERDKQGQYQDRNRVVSIITPEHISYSEYMNGQDIPWSM